MLSRLKSKLTGTLIGAVAVMAIVGAGAAMASQNHVGPFTSSGSTGLHATAHDATETTSSVGTPTKEPGDGDDGANQNNEDNGDNGEDQELSGTVQSIDTGGQTFVLTPDNGGAAVTIAFDSKTQIEHEDNGTQFAAGAHVRVEVVKRADGSLYATEIKAGKDSGDDGQGGSDDGGSGD